LLPPLLVKTRNMLAFSMDRLSGSQIYLVKKYIIECSSLLLLPQGSLTNTQSQHMLMRRATLPMDAMNEVMIAPDFLALGLGGTNMMSMLWTVAMGRQAVVSRCAAIPFSACIGTSVKTSITNSA